MIRRHRYLETAFALPTILIASVVMIIVMLASIQSVVSIRIALDNQYYDKLAQEAAESGATMATSCIKAGTVTWANPLRPGSTCAGSNATSYLLSTPNIRTSFSVTSTGSAGNYVVSVSTTVELLRTSNSLPWKTFTQSTTKTIKPLGWDSIAVGYSQTCGILSGGAAYCWGSNATGQLGIGTVGNATADFTPSPVAVRANSGDALFGKAVTKISAGGGGSNGTTCAIATGSLYCWGYNGDYQLANGTTTNSGLPTLIGGNLAGKTVTDVDVGWNNVCAIASGLVYCWGDNTYYQIGNGTSTNPVTAPAAIYSAAITSGSTLGRHSGFYTGADASIPAVPTSISVGAHQACATTRAATTDYLYCWGRNNAAEGRLGINDTASDKESTPRRITAIGTTGMTFSQLAEGPAHGCVVANNTRAWCWGAGTIGQIGSAGTPIHRPAPVGVSQATPPSGLGSGAVTLLSSGYNYSCAAVPITTLYCWGRGTSGQIGNGALADVTVPKAVTQAAGVLAGESIKSISAGDLTACVLTVSGRAICWGSGEYAALGDGTPATAGRYVPNPVKVDVSTLPISYAIY